MNFSECPRDPYACECSMFFKWFSKRKGKWSYWVECVDKWYKDERGVWHPEKEGALCVANPENWHEEWREREKQGMLRG
jgi:hypothetical protein